MNIAQFKKALPALRLITAPGPKKPTERTLDIDTVDGALRLTAQDNVTTLEIKALGVETSNYNACVDFTKFNSLMGMLKVMPSFDWEPGKKYDNGAKDLDALVLKSGKRVIKLDSAKLQRWDHGEREFSEVGDNGLQWNVSRLMEGLEYIAPAISNDETRFHLNGVLLAPNGDMVSTDGHRLHVYSYHHFDDSPASFFASEGRTLDTILPKRQVKMLQAAIKACGDKAEVYSCRGVIKGGRHVQFVIDGKGLSFTITCKLIESRFPPYHAVIPKSNSWRARAVVNTLDFCAAAKLVDKMSDAVKGVEFRLNGELHIKGGGVSESMEASYEGEGFEYGELGANGKYLVDAADMPSEACTIEFGKALEPIKFTQGGGFLAVVMPMRV